MRLKLYIFLCIFCSLTVNVFAQQDPQFSQFFNNKLFFNPAYAGSKLNKICANFNARAQYLGFGGGESFQNTLPNGDKQDVPRGFSPTTFNLGIHTHYKRLAIGLNVMSDLAGFETTLAPTLSLGYIQPIGSNGIRLTLAGGVGFIQKGLDGAQFRPIDQNDPAIPNSFVVGYTPNFDVGVFLGVPQIGGKFIDFYFGASSTHLNKPKVELVTSKYDYVQHYYAFTGITYQMNNFDITPNILYKTEGTNNVFDFNILGTYKQKIVGGVSYRIPQEFSFMAGYNFPFMSLLYSYDLLTNSIAKSSSGSHEISLRYCFNYKPTVKLIPFYPIKTPRML